MQSAAVFQLHLTGKQKTSAASKHSFSTAFSATITFFFNSTGFKHIKNHIYNVKVCFKVVSGDYEHI